ncbi:hypothetical protein Tco_0552964 [Tanacetum coccineum]
MNELVRNQCDVINHKVNVQFLIQLQPEWQRFVTLVKQSQALKPVSYHNVYDILKQHQNEFNEIRAKRLARTQAKDAAYHKENMLLCKQEEVGFQLNAQQVDWRDDTDDERDDQELEAHYMYMAQIQEVTLDDVDNSGPIFDAKPLEKVQNNDDNYNVFAIESEHPEHPESINDTCWE